MKKNGLSAKNTDRVQLHKMLDDLKEFDAVLVFRLSRLTRSVSDFSNLLNIFNKNNVSFISYSEKFNTSEITRKIINVYYCCLFRIRKRDNL